MLIGPYFIDWTAYRADFEREASRIIGQRVVVRGEASARLLPFPTVTFSDVEVEGEPGAPPLMTIDRFRMDAELAPYLSGEIRIFSARLESPKLRLPIGRDGRLASALNGGALPTRAAVVLEDVAVVGGTVLIEDAASGRRFSLDRISGNFAARSLAGPFSGGGRVDTEGRQLAFQLSTGAAETERGLPLKLTVDDRALDLVTIVDGIASAADGAPRLEGSVRIATTQADDRKPTEGKSAVPTPPPSRNVLPPFGATGKLAVGPRGVDVSDLRVTAGRGEKPYILTGSGSLALGRLPSFQLALDGEQVDIDAIATEGRPKGSVTLDGRLEAARRILLAVPRPSIPGSVKLTLPVVVAGDTTIRDLGVSASPTSEGWSVERFAAELPGRTRMDATGILDLVDHLSFRGSLLVAARQPSGFADWLTGAVDPAIRTLPLAGFSASVDLSRDRQDFEDLEINIGGDTLKGRLERTGPAGSRSLAAELAGGRIDFDAFVAMSRLFTGESDSIADAERGSLRVAAGPIVYAGEAADRVDADVSYDGTKLTINRFALGGFAGSDIDASGLLDGLGGDISGRIDVGLRSASPAVLIDTLGARLPPSPALDILRKRAPQLGPLALKAVLGTAPGRNGERPTLRVDIAGKAAGTDVTLGMVLGNGIYAGGTSGEFGLDLALANADPGELLGQVGIETLPLPTPSPLALKLSLSAGPTGPVAVSAGLRAPGSELTAEGTVDVAIAGLKSADIAVSGRSDDIAPWLLATGNALGEVQGSTVPATLGGTVAYDGSAVALKGFEGSFGDTDVSADLEKGGDGPLTGSAFFSKISAPWLAALVYGGTPLDPARADRWSTASFGRSALAETSLSLDVTADRLDLGGAAAVGSASAHVEARAGELSIQDIRGAIGGGYGTGSLRFRNAGGVGGFSATADLQGLDLGTLALTGFALPSEEDEGAAGEGARPALTGTMDARVTLDATGQSYAAMLSAMTGAGSVRVEDATFRGVKPGLLPFVLKASDVDGFEASPENVAALVSRFTGDAAYPVPAASAEFSVTGGVTRFPAVKLDRPGERLTAEGSLDLAKSSVAGLLRLDLDPGDDAVEGATPSVDYALSGPVAEPRLVANVQPLANFLSIRTLEREQARVEAIQDGLQEKLRLRREVRLYRWRAERRLAAEVISATAERLRLERTEEQTAARLETERAAAEALAEAQAERARLTEREKRERDEDAKRRQPTQTPAVEPRLDFSGKPSAREPPAASQNIPSLPGVRDPFDLNNPATGG